MAAAQIFAVIIFVAMFLLIVMDKIERHIVTLGCGLLTLIVVFGMGHSCDQRLRRNEFLVSGHRERKQRYKLGDYPLHCRYDGNGRGYGKSRILPMALHEDSLPC